MNYLNKTQSIKDVEAINWDHIIVQVSGGKDSVVLLDYAVKQFGAKNIIAMHCIIDLDWPETRRIVKEQCDQVGVKLVEVQAVDRQGNKKGILDHLVQLKKQRSTGLMVQNLWPSKQNRWCTGLFKTGPAEKWIRNNCSGKILNMTGERRQESKDRSKLDYWEVKESCKVTNHKLARQLVYFRPILDLDIDTIWAAIKENNLIKHPCYGLGVSRAGCSICIFSSSHEIKLAATNAPTIVSKMLEAEGKISHAFRYRPATKTREALKISIKDIITKELTIDELELLNNVGNR